MEKKLQTIHAKKSLGQNFLTNPRVPEWMADAGEVGAGDTVLEIGPGTGMLTREFLKRGANVVAVEADERAITALTETFAEEIAEGTFTLHHGDIREVNLTDIGLSNQSFILVANIPYYLSGILFRLFLSGACQPKTLIFLVQKEVAERIARDPKESLLSLSVKAYGMPRYIKTVSRGNFSPQPKVDSAIIAVSGISKDNFGDLSEVFFFQLLHLGLGSKRKQLLGNLSKQFDRSLLEETFSTLNIQKEARGEDLGLPIWLKLATFLEKSTNTQ